MMIQPKQPKERMDRLFSKYENLLRKSLGDDIVAVYAMGSGAIPGMAGSPMVDILLAMKNSPPTDAQVKGICKSYQDDFCFKIQTGQIVMVLISKLLGNRIS